MNLDYYEFRFLKKKKRQGVCNVVVVHTPALNLFDEKTFLEVTTFPNYFNWETSIKSSQEINLGLIKIASTTAKDRNQTVLNYHGFRAVFTLFMQVVHQKNNSTRSETPHSLINGSNYVNYLTPESGEKTAKIETDSFLLDTVTQLNISDLQPDTFIRYLTQQLKRSRKLEERRKCKKLFEKRLRKYGYIIEADKLKRCCANFTTLVCGNGHSFRPIVDYRCHLPFCPDCWEAKSHRELGRNLPKFLQALKDDPSLIVAFTTLTLKSDGRRDLIDGNNLIKSDFRKLRRRDVWEKCVGGFGRIENTFSTKFGWHPHLHSLILLKDYIPQSLLSDAWLSITHDSKIVDIRQVRDLAAGLIETIKYPFKPTDLKHLGKNQIEEMLNAKGQRLGVSFGVLFGIETDLDGDDVLDAEYADFIEQTKTLQMGDPCPICQSKLDVIDFTADGYAQFLGNIPIQNRARGKPS